MVFLLDVDDSVKASFHLSVSVVLAVRNLQLGFRVLPFVGVLLESNLPRVTTN
jgi:hypothetical protein